MKIYIVSPFGYEYNDEYYYEAGLDAPQKVFKSKDLAEEYAKQEAYKQMISCDGDEYINLSQDFSLPTLDGEIYIRDNERFNYYRITILPQEWDSFTKEMRRPWYDIFTLHRITELEIEDV